MAAMKRRALAIVSLLWLSLLCCSNATRVFNVMEYGAAANNKTDNSQAFNKAWQDTCKWRGKSSLLVPRGVYMLGPVVLTGPCNGPKEFVIQGVLRAPNDPGSFFTDHWISFQRIDQLAINGGGTLDGQGAVAWPYNNCQTGSCKPLPVSMRLDFINNSSISHLKSINSKNKHFNIFACNHLNIRNVVILAPKDSPNTDGIHIGDSEDIWITKAKIATGDDCISITSGNRRILISKTFCGPGHGISVGSMGKSDTEEVVTDIHVVNCTFLDTLNGVQIKTWPDSKAAGGFASNFIYDNLVMENVINPIFINQQYCPFNLCNSQGSSQIQVSNVTFKDIRGTSASRDAVKLQCSKSKPCRNISLENINLKYANRGYTYSLCSNAQDIMFRGRQSPPSCVH